MTSLDQLSLNFTYKLVELWLKFQMQINIHLLLHEVVFKWQFVIILLATKFSQLLPSTMLAILYELRSYYRHSMHYAPCNQLKVTPEPEIWSETQAPNGITLQLGGDNLPKLLAVTCQLKHKTNIICLLMIAFLDMYALI